MSRKSQKQGKPRFFAVLHHITESFAWSQLPANARAAYVEIGTLYNGANNGQLAVSSRWLGERLNVEKTTAQRALTSLLTYGFLRIARRSTFNKKRLATEYAFTHMRCDATGELPTNDYERITHSLGQPPKRTENVVKLSSKRTYRCVDAPIAKTNKCIS